MIWLKPKPAVKMSIFDPSVFVLSLLAYHEFDFGLKSPRKTIRDGFLSAIKFSKNFSNASVLTRVIYKETKLTNFSRNS